MVYSYSAVRVRRGAGAIAGGVVVCARTTTTDEHSAINIATDAAATTRRNRRFSNLTIRYRAAIRLRVENLSNRISNYKDHGISKSGRRCCPDRPAPRSSGIFLARPDAQSRTEMSGTGPVAMSALGQKQT